MRPFHISPKVLRSASRLTSDAGKLRWQHQPPPLPLLSGRSIHPFFTARWLQRAGSPLVPERLLRDAACTRLVWQKYSRVLHCQVATEGRVATESLNGSSRCRLYPYCLAEVSACSFTARWLQRAGSPLVPERLLRDAACTRPVWQKYSPFLHCQVATEGRVATGP